MDDTIARLLEELSGTKMAIFVGRNDTGKSTLIKRIADVVDVSVIDADIGQSDMGPPTVVSLGERYGKGYRMTDGYFCGSTTPAKHFLQLIAGTARMAGRVKRRPVLVNTTGLATGEVGRILKTEKINALRPDVIVGLGNGLEYLDAFARAGVSVIHLPVSPDVHRKTPSERKMIRQNKFEEHFKNATTVCRAFDSFSVERSLLLNGTSFKNGEIILHSDISDGDTLAVVSDKNWDPGAFMKLRNVKVMQVYTPEDFTNVLVGLVDSEGKFAGHGIINSIDFKNEEVSLQTPAHSFCILQFGSIKLDPKDYSYLGPFSGHAYRA